MVNRPNSVDENTMQKFLVFDEESLRIPEGDDELVTSCRMTSLNIFVAVD